jgi:nucleotide-binding universal stress UspA family protein
VARDLDADTTMRRILVALDGSAASSMVLDRAVQLARDTGAKLRLIRAVPLPPMAPPVADSLRADGYGAVLASAEGALRTLESSVPEAMRDGTVVEIGSAVEAIRRTADAYDADVVVIGAHRIGPLRRALGATAAKIVNALERPVLVVRSPRATPAGDTEAARFADHDKHPLLETATLAGAASGAVAGAIGGVPGVVAGSMIGTALGMLAGEKLESSERERASRESEVAKRPAPTDSHGRPLRAGEAMRQDHELLDELYRDLLASYDEGQWSDVAAQWSVFEPALRMHMDAEERDVFPAFRKVDATETEELLVEHAELRERLGTLGMLLELHAVPAHDAEDLVSRLRAHAAHEAALLYPWMDEAIRIDASKSGSLTVPYKIAGLSARNG